MRNYYIQNLPWYVGNRGECKREKYHRGVTETLLKVDLPLKRKVRPQRSHISDTNQKQLLTVLVHKKLHILLSLNIPPLLAFPCLTGNKRFRSLICLKRDKEKEYQNSTTVHRPVAVAIMFNEDMRIYLCESPCKIM